MRVGRVLLCVAMGAMTPAVAADIPVGQTQTTATSLDQRWKAEFDLEARFYSWKGSMGFPATGVSVSGLPGSAPRGSGRLVHVPFGLSVTGLPTDDWKVEFNLRSAYVRAQQTTPGMSGTYSGATDTSLSGTFTYNGWNGVQPFVSLNINVPTGTSELTDSAQNARMDPDLVGLSTFGEGFNAGVTGGTRVALSDSILAGFGVGYTNRGPYDRDMAGSSTLGGIGNGVTLAHLDPGDVVTANASLAFQLGNLTVQSSGSMSSETQTDSNGTPFYKTGNGYIIESSAAYTWGIDWTTKLSGMWAHTNKNKVLVNAPILIVEAFNSNSNLYNVTLEHRFKIDRVSLGPTGGYLFRDHNAWVSSANQFVPQKTRWSAGGVFEFSITEQISLRTRAERMWVSEGDFPELSVLATKSTGWLVSGGGTISF